MKARLSILVLVTLATVWQRCEAGVTAIGWTQVDSAGASALPVALTGWNSDVIWPGQSPGFDGGCYLWIQETFGYRGFPSSGRFASAYNSNVVFQLQPFSGSNVLLMTSAIEPGNEQYVKLPDNPTGALSMVVPARYSFLAVAASSGGGGGIGTVVLKFADGTSSREFPLMAPDWWNYDHSAYWVDPQPPGAAAITGLARVFSVPGAGGMTFDNGVYQGVGGNGFALYESDIDLAAEGLSLKALTSISFTKPPAKLRKGTVGPWTTAIFSVSGILNEPSITGILKNDADRVQLKVSGPTNALIRVDVSNDLRSWKPVVTMTNSVGTMQATDWPHPASAERFYRAVQVE